MFWNLRHQLAEEAKKSGDPNVPNFKNALVDICWSSSEKQKGAPPTQRGVGKERKNVRFELIFIFYSSFLFLILIILCSFKFFI